MAECTPILSAATSLFGVALGGLIGYLSASRVSNKNAKAVAAAKFRASFSAAIAHIHAAERHRRDDTDRPNVSSSLAAMFVEHATAIEEFRPFVGLQRQAAYNKAWNDYCELEPTRWGGGAEFMAEGVNPDKPLKVIKIRIQTLLSYAD